MLRFSEVAQRVCDRSGVAQLQTFGKRLAEIGESGVGLRRSQKHLSNVVQQVDRKVGIARLEGARARLMKVEQRRVCAAETSMRFANVGKRRGHRLGVAGGAETLFRRVEQGERGVALKIGRASCRE